MNKSIIRFSADGQVLTMAGHMFYASQTINYIEAEFSLKHNWLEYDAVSAIWTTPYISIETVIGPTRKCLVPHEVLARKGKVTVNLVGTKIEDDEVVDRLTTYPVVAIIVDAASQISGGDTQPITPSQYEQFVASVQEAVSEIKDIESTVLNDNYTLTFFYSDGTSYTVGPIRGAQGPQGEKGDPGEQGEKGDPGTTDYEELTNKPTIPSKVSDLTNDSGYITGYTETDPTVPSWAKSSSKPSYTFSEIGTKPTSISGYGITDAYTKTEVDGLVSGVLHYKGTKETTSALPSSGNVTGDVWHVTADGSEWAWDGTQWQELGTAVDLSGYVQTSRKVNGKALTSDITLSASDVSALPSSTVIPTKVSDLTNDSGFLTLSTLPIYQGVVQ